MPVKKNTTTQYALNMSEQENRENIIRMTEQIKSIATSLDVDRKSNAEKFQNLTKLVSDGFSDIKINSGTMEKRYASKEELYELKRNHQSLVKYLMTIVIAIVLIVITGVMALLGIQK